MGGKAKVHVLVLLGLLLLTRVLFFSVDRPLLKDENLYAQMADEWWGNPKIIPTYFGQQVAWRPFIPFFASGLLAYPSQALFEALDLQIDAGIPYRLHSSFFGAGAILVFYFLFKREYSADLAFAACALLSVSFVSAYVDTSALVDSVLLFFIALSLYFYFGGGREEEKKGLERVRHEHEGLGFGLRASGFAGSFFRELFLNGKWQYLLGGLFAAAAYWTKTVVALIIPVVVLAYVFFKRKGELKNPVFVFSLLLLPLSAVVYDSFFTDRAAISGEYFANIPNKIFNPEGGVLGSFAATLKEFVAFNIMILGPFAYAFWKFWRQEKWLSVWAGCLVLTLFVGMGYFWYPIPAMPAVSVFIAMLLFEKGSGWRADKFSVFLLVVACLIVLYLTYAYAQLGFEGEGSREREAGLFLSGKGNVLVVGEYAPTAMFYKMKDGLPAPCIAYAGNLAHLNESDWWKDNVYSFGKGLETNYSYKYSFEQMFWNFTDIRHDCGERDFTWILARSRPGRLGGLENYSVAASFGNSTVYSRIG